MERSKRANRGQNYARWAAEDRLEDEKVSKKRKTTPDEDYTQDQDQDQVRCICGATSYDEADPREMVECEKCLTWQHIDCVTNGAGESQLPDPYVCSQCSHPAKKEPSPAPQDSLPKDKVRQSVITALDTVFTKQLIPMAQKEGLLAADLDAAAYSLELAKEIELALFTSHGGKKNDVGAKYREKFRALSFNLKNDKNHHLQTQIITRTVSPQALAVLSADEMLSPELRKLADQVKQESIQGSILKVDEGPRVRKTHKGEEIVENENEPDAPTRDSSPEQADEDGTPNGSAAAAAAAAASAVAQDQPRIVEAQYDNVDNFEEPDFSPASPGYSDGEYDDFEATMGSAAIIETPVWTGKLALKDVASINAKAMHLGTNNSSWTSADWSRVFKTTTQPTELKGRVAETVAAPYVDRMAEFRVVAAVAFTSDDTDGYETLFNHYHTRQKYGVITSHTALAKDAYLISLAPNEQLPHCLSSTADAIDQLRKDHQNLLIGVYVLPKSDTIAGITSS